MDGLSDRRARPVRLLTGIAKPVAGFLALLLFWQWGAPLASIPSYVLPLPTAIAARFAETFAVQLAGLSATGMTTVVGLVLALVVGVLMALAVIYVPFLRSLIMPLLAAFNSIPKIAIAPLFVIWFGLGAESKILLAFLLALFPVFVNALTGLGEIEPDLLDLSILAGGNPWRIFLKLRLMHAVPYITDALKVAFPLALVGSIVGEFIGGNEGIGHLILAGQFDLDTPLVFAALTSITAFTTLGIGAIAVFERAVLKWRPSQRRR
jgi:NitT/TauT family transport system permease protein